MTRLLLWALLGLLSTLAPAASLDDDFLAAREAFRIGDSKKLESYAQRFKGHLLEPYITYWRLRTRLDATNTDDIRGFINANRDTPLSERLRNEWLKLLGKNQQWELFEAELPQLLNDDLEITCYSLQSRLRLDALALREARPLWFVGRDLPESCTPLFNALAAS